MRFGLISDLHIEYRGYTIKPDQLPDVDVMLLPGDIGPGASGIKWASETFASHGIECLYVAGNHEFYTSRYTYDEVRQRLTSWSRDGVYYLQDSVREYPEAKIAVLGATLWTDFRLNGRQSIDLRRAPQIMNDYKWMDRNPEQILSENTVSLMWLQHQIQLYYEKDWKVVVMSHHAPSPHSVSEKYFGSINNVFYANTFDQYPAWIWPNFWVHGHMHNHSDYEIKGCRVLANPRGYVWDERQPENPMYRHDLTFEV